MSKVSQALASVFVAAVKLREESYDFEAAVAAEKETARSPCDKSPPKLVNYLAFYQVPWRVACNSAAESEGCPELAEIVYLLTQNSLDETLAWAKAYGFAVSFSADYSKRRAKFQRTN